MTGGNVTYTSVRNAGLVLAFPTAKVQCSVFEMLRNKVDQNPKKKHGNIPL